MNLNKVMLIWRATNNFQLKTIESSNTEVVNFTIVTNRKFKNKEWNMIEEAEYHRCVAYGKWAEVLGKYLTKWKRIYLEWRLRTRKWTDSAGVDKYSTEIIVDKFIFLDSKPKEDDEKIDWEKDNSLDVENDEEIPF